MKRGDLDSVNAIIKACITEWNLPERVKRLSLSSYQYTVIDLEHLSAVVAVTTDNEIVGAAAWEHTDTNDLPRDQHGVLLHGLYVHPHNQLHGIGKRFIKSALEDVRRQGLDGILVKAQSDAISYFQSQGFTILPVENSERDYPHRWWKAL
jgi:N-acetylglutamate synthase-like GNAT family acetyltransferase